MVRGVAPLILREYCNFLIFCSLPLNMQHISLFDFQQNNLFVLICIRILSKYALFRSNIETLIHKWSIFAFASSLKVQHVPSSTLLKEMGH